MELIKFTRTNAGYSVIIEPTVNKEQIRINFVEINDITSSGFEGLKIKNIDFKLRDFKREGRKLFLQKFVNIDGDEKIIIEAIGRFENDDFYLGYKFCTHNDIQEFDNGGISLGVD